MEIQMNADLLLEIIILFSSLYLETPWNVLSAFPGSSLYLKYFFHINLALS